MAKKPGKKAKAASKEKLLSLGSGLSGIMGVFSSWAVCHNVCMAAIALLAVLGVTVTGMPLLFLQDVAVPLWTLAVVIFAILLFLKVRKMGCLPGKALLLNAGLIVAGTPFKSAMPPQAFWIVGGSLVLAAAFLFAKDKLR